MTIINKLLAKGARVNAFDPIAMPEAGKIFAGTEGITFGKDMYEVLNNADALIIVTEWKEFRSPDFTLMMQNLNAPVIFDGRNLYEPEWLRDIGFCYHSIGRRVWPSTTLKDSSLHFGAA